MSVLIQAIMTRAFQSYLLDLWNLLGFNAIGLPVITTMLIGHDDRSQNGLNTFMVGLLRIKVLAFLKVVNMDMAIYFGLVMNSP